MKRTFAPPEHAEQLPTAAAPENVLPDASASTVVFGGGWVLPPAYAEDSHSSSMRNCFDEAYTLSTSSRRYRALLLMSMYCAPRAFGRLPVLAVLNVLPSLLVRILYA